MSKINVRQGFINLARYLSLLIVTYIAFSFLFVVCNIYDDLVITPELWKFPARKENQVTIAIISPVRPGEKQQAVMIHEAAQKLGHLVYRYAFNDTDMDMFLPAKYMNEILIYILNKLFKPDFHLAMSFHVNLDVPDPKVMYISVPPEYYVEKVNNQYLQVRDYNNFIDINLVNTQEDWLSPILGKKVNRYYGIVGVPANEYKPSPHNKLVLFGSLWGRKTDNLYSAIKELAKQDYMYFIKHTFLVFDQDEPQKFSEAAKGLPALQERLNEYGIGLCAHSRYHVKEGVPSSRIFEIISSGAIAISDMNPFIMRFFGDNVLYFDQTASAEDIFKQIDNHVKWIISNPELADQKARNAHKTLQDQFTTEKFIKDMIGIFKQ